MMSGSLPLNLKSPASTPTFESELSLTERAQYEKIIAMLTNKVSKLTVDLKSTQTQCGQQISLINALNLRNEAASRQSNLFVQKAVKATKIVKQLSEATYIEQQNQSQELEQLRKENELLRKILNINNMLVNTDQIDQSLKAEEQKLKVEPKKEALSLAIAPSKEEPNPFNSKPKAQSSKCIPAFSPDSQSMMKMAVRKTKASKRPRSTSFYFAPPTPDDNEESFDDFDFDNTKASTPCVPKKSSRPLFSFQDSPSPEKKWKMQSAEIISEKSSSPSVEEK